MSSELKIEREDDGAQGRYVIYMGDGSEAEMTYRRRADGTIAIDHTGVPTQHRGQGLAERLVKRAVEDARSSGEKIAPYSSYVVAQFRRHPEWADLKAQ